MFNAVSIFLSHILLCKKLVLILAEQKRHLLKKHCKYKLQVTVACFWRLRRQDSRSLWCLMISRDPSWRWPQTIDILVIQIHHGKCIVNQWYHESKSHFIYLISYILAWQHSIYYKVLLLLLLLLFDCLFSPLVMGTGARSCSPGLRT